MPGKTRRSPAPLHPLLAAALVTLAVDAHCAESLLKTVLRSPYEARADADALAAEWIARLGEQPADPAAELALHRLKNMLADTAEPAALLGPLEDLLSRHELGGVADGLLRDCLDSILERTGDTGRREEIRANAGFLTHWAVIGPFGLGSTSDLRRAFAPETGVDLSRPLDGQRRRVVWRQVPLAHPVRRHHPRGVLSAGDGVYYSLAQIRSDRTRPARLHVETAQPVSIMLNDRTALEDPLDAFLGRGRRVEVSLREGWNRILVKSAGQPLALRVTALDNYPLEAPALEQETDLILHEPAPEAGDPNPERESVPARAPEAPAPDADASALAALDHLAEACLASWNERHDLAVDRAEMALALLPEDAHVNYHAGQIFAAAEHLPSEYTGRRARLLFEKALEADEAFVPAKLEFASYLLRDGEVARAALEARGALELNDRCVPALRFLLDLYEEQAWEQEGRELAARMSSRVPASPLPALYRAHLAESRHNTTEALTQYRLALQKDPGQPDLLERIARLEVRRGRPDLAREALETWVRLRPGTTTPGLALADFFRDRGELEASLETLTRLATSHPETAEIWRRIAAAQEQLGRTEDAMGTYERVVAMRPGDLSALNWLRALRGSMRLRYWAPFDETLEEWIPKIPATEAYPQAESIAVLDIAVVKIFPDGSTAEYTHQAFKLLSEASKENLADVQTRGEILQLRTITPEGQTLEPVAAEGKESFVMPGLAVGGIIEFAFATSPSGSNPWAVRNGPFFFQDFTHRRPFLLSRYVVIVPEALDLEVVERALDHPSEPESEAQFARVIRTERLLDDGSRAIIFETREAPRIEPEIRMPDREEYIPNVLVTEKREWIDVADRLADLMHGRTRSTPDLERFAREVVGEITGPRGRARALHSRVNELIANERGPRDACGILAERAGDRNTLFKALAEAIGIHARWAFVRPPPPIATAGALDHPDPGLFEQAFVVVETGEGPADWVDLGTRFVPFGKLPERYEGGTALVLDPEGAALRPVPRAPPEESAESTHAVLRPGQVENDPRGVRASVRIVSRAYRSFGEKVQLRDVDEHLRGQVLRRLGSRLFPGARFRRAEILSLDTPYTPLEIELDLDVPGYLEGSGPRAPLRPLFQPTRMVRSFIRSPNRRHPYRFDGRIVRRDRIEIDLAPGYALRRLPIDTLLVSALGSYSLRFHRDGPRLVVHRDVNLEPGVIPPDEFPRFLEFCRAVDQAEAERILLEID